MSGTNKASNDGSETAQNPVRKMPDYSRCLVRRSDMAVLVICLVADPSGCKYAERHAFDTFCIHPQWWEILARSEASR